MYNISELKNRPLFSLTVEEFLSVQQSQSIEPTKKEVVKDEEKKYVYGYKGLAELFGCSIPTAANIKLSGKINGAITQIGRKIIIDAEKALELAGRKNGGRK